MTGGRPHRLMSLGCCSTLALLYVLYSPTWELEKDPGGRSRWCVSVSVFVRVCMRVHVFVSLNDNFNLYLRGVCVYVCFN